MNNTNQILEFLKAELNSIASNDISIEDSNRIASELFKKCNDIERCLDLLSLLKSNSNKTLSFKKFASSYLQNIYQSTSTAPIKSQVINTNSEKLNDNMVPKNKDWNKFANEGIKQNKRDEELEQYRKKIKFEKQKFIYIDNYGSDILGQIEKKIYIMGALKAWWIVVGVFLLDTIIGYLIVKDYSNLQEHWSLTNTLIDKFLYPVFCSANWQLHEYMYSEDVIFFFVKGSPFGSEIFKFLRAIFIYTIMFVTGWLAFIKFIVLLTSPYFFWCVFNWIYNKLFKK